MKFIGLVIFLDVVRDLFAHKVFSEKGSTERAREEATYMFFLDFLEECAGMKHKEILSTFLNFF